MQFSHFYNFRALSLRPWFILSFLLTCVVAVDINNGCRIAEHFKFKWGPDVEWKVFAILMAYSLAMLINISRPFISFNKLYLNLPQIQLLGGPQKRNRILVEAPKTMFLILFFSS